MIAPFDIFGYVSPPSMDGDGGGVTAAGGAGSEGGVCGSGGGVCASAVAEDTTIAEANNDAQVRSVHGLVIFFSSSHACGAKFTCRRFTAQRWRVRDSFVTTPWNLT